MPAIKKQAHNIKLRVNIDADMYKELTSFQANNGLAYEADVVRMALRRLFDSKNEKLIHKPLNNSL